ncbi:nuclease-related domain-containing protein [Glacieibacterium frigidum]|uniref:nuclease-related domain-containing protein n=1 Tax=Glacieibacterium frigidum TaxID=2593303 RepID=UPI00163D7376|nr:nuclease-related domain-containing protein [Glacieibacterium frigidum]
MQRQQISDQIRNLRSGDRGEAEAAYEIDLHFGRSPNWMIIHDLRIEHRGFVAQIDHLMINRLLEFWVLESKRFANGVKINEHGEFTTFYDRVPRGAASPIEQNRRHIKVLETVIADGMIRLPSRIGFTVQPKLKSLVLISQGAINRPRTHVPGIETVIKNDQLSTTVNRALDKVGVLALTSLVGQATLEGVGHQMLALHRPITRRWAAQFRLSDTPIPAAEPQEAAANSTLARRRIGPAAASQAAPERHCTNCAVPVSQGVARYCTTQPLFGGAIFCMSCQSNALRQAKLEAARP